MTTGQQAAVDQRLDQHADAIETILDKIDSLERRAQILHRHADLVRTRIKNLEDVLFSHPDAQKPGWLGP